MTKNYKWFLNFCDKKKTLHKKSILHFVCGINLKWTVYIAKKLSSD